MRKKTIILTGALLAAASVGIGAFGAHGLKDLLEQTGKTNTFETAVRYQFYHALALMLSGILMHLYKSTWLKTATWFFLAGIALFSGSLYLLSLSGIQFKWFMGMLAPIGGLSFIVGWVLLGLGCWKKNQRK